MNQEGPATAENLQQRRHDRYLVEMPGLLRLPETRGGIYVITLLDVSKSGLRISCPQTLLSDTRVEIRCQGAKIFGVVRYSREVKLEFHAGIEADGAEFPAGTPIRAELDLTSLFRRNLSKWRTA